MSSTTEDANSLVVELTERGMHDLALRALRVALDVKRLEEFADECVAQSASCRELAHQIRRNGRIVHVIDGSGLN